MSSAITTIALCFRINFLIFLIYLFLVLCLSAFWGNSMAWILDRTSALREDKLSHIVASASYHLRASWRLWGMVLVVGGNVFAHQLWNIWSHMLQPGTSPVFEWLQRLNMVHRKSISLAYEVATLALQYLCYAVITAFNYTSCLWL